MSEVLYEGMFLLDSSRFANDSAGMSAKIVALVEKLDGTVVAHRPWQDGRLAYEIEDRRKGVHYLTYFRMDPARMKELNRACKLSEDVIRNMFIKQPKVLFDQMVAALTGETTEGSDETSKEAPVEPKTSDKGDAGSKPEAGKELVSESVSEAVKETATE